MYVIAARNEDLGLTALNELKSEIHHMSCADLRFHQLDITNQSSIMTLKNHLVEKHGGLDILVNNAAIAFKVIVNLRKV